MQSNRIPSTVRKILPPARRYTKWCRQAGKRIRHQDPFRTRQEKDVVGGLELLEVRKNLAPTPTKLWHHLFRERSPGRLQKEVEDVLPKRPCGDFVHVRAMDTPAYIEHFADGEWRKSRA